MVPVSGSAYTYAYATLGELVAWIIGWDLIIEYAIGNVAVALMHGSPCAVGIAPGGYADREDRGVSTIVVGYDATPVPTQFRSTDGTWIAGRDGPGRRYRRRTRSLRARRSRCRAPCPLPARTALPAQADRAGEPPALGEGVQ